jgi:hypothetical protein
VDDVWPGRLPHLAQVGKALSNAKAFTQLLRHEQFPIANGQKFAIRDPMNGMHMLIGDLAAADYGDF